MFDTNTTLYQINRFSISSIYMWWSHKYYINEVNKEYTCGKLLIPTVVIFLALVNWLVSINYVWENQKIQLNRIIFRKSQQALGKAQIILLWVKCVSFHILIQHHTHFGIYVEGGESTFLVNSLLPGFGLCYKKL